MRFPRSRRRFIELPIIKAKEPGTLHLTNDQIYDIIFPRCERGETESGIWFCRLTQLGLLRLLSAEAVMGVDVHTHQLAWQSYRKWFDDDRVGFSPEPDMGGLDPRF